MTNKYNHQNHSLPIEPNDFDMDATFCELQALWDEQCRNIDRHLSQHDRTLPSRHTPRQRWSYRRVLISEYLALAILHIATALYALVVFVSDGYPLYLITGLAVTSISACVAGYSLWTMFALCRHKPDRVSVAEMSDFIGRMRLRPFHTPSRIPESPKPRLDLPTTIRRPLMAASVAAVLIIVVTVAPVGDSYTMSVSRHSSRVEAIDNVNQILHRI